MTEADMEDETLSYIKQLNWMTLSEESVIDSIISRGEGQHVEFKQRMPPLSTLARLAAAFINSGGGLILIGVDDSGDVIGIPQDLDIAKQLKAATQFFRDGASYDSLSGTLPYRGKHLGVVKIGALGTPDPPVEVEGSLFKRIGHVVAAVTPSEWAASISASLDPRPVDISDTDFRRFLADADEDAITEKLIVPLLRHLGFESVFAKGHRDKSLEFGQDIRGMKYRLPTGDWLYFAVQIKSGDLAASRKVTGNNVEELFQQTLMAFGRQVFDPHTNSYHAVNHVLVVASGEIGAGAQEYFHRRLAELPQPGRVLWMDKNRLLDLAQRVGLPLGLQTDIRLYLKALDIAGE